MKLYSIILFLISFNLNAQNQSKLINSVLKELKIDISTCKTNLIVEKVIPNTPTKSIVVIPELVSTYNQQNDCCFELNSYILIVNNVNYKIENKFYEVSSSNNWVSDAVVLSKISIDTAPYFLSNDKRAFGIRVRYTGSSRVNPYGYETISLFEQQHNTLKRLLKNYTVKSYNGEWDGNCIGEFSNSKKTLIITNNLTNSYSNILIKNTITKSIALLDKNNNCNEKETIKEITEVLKYKNGSYNSL